MALPVCFENFIGIRGDCNEKRAPISGYYINDLEGITLQTAAKIANEEQITGIQLLKDKIEFAIKAVKDELTAKIESMGLFRFNAELFDEQVGVFGDDYLPAVSFQRGLLIKSLQNERFGALIIKSVNIHTQYDESVLLTLTDGALIKTFDIQTIGGKSVNFPLNYRVENNKVSLTMSDVAVNNSDLTGANCNGCRGGRRASAYNDWFIAQGIDNGVYSSSTFGLSVNIGVSCDDWALLCGLSHRIGSAVLYRAGIAVLQERIFTDRKNFVTISKEDSVLLLNAWTQEYEKKTEALSAQLPMMLKNYQSACFSCLGAKSKLIRL